MQVPEKALPSPLQRSAGEGSIRGELRGASTVDEYNCGSYFWEYGTGKPWIFVLAFDTLLLAPGGKNRPQSALENTMNLTEGT